ncbi:MAG: hypothetical protein IJ220_01150 [Clostridia bacterium]|nr:hypothetical protein [Clostridia bacterium]
MKGFVRFLIAIISGSAVLLFRSAVVTSAICLWQKGGPAAYATLVAFGRKAITPHGVVVAAIEAAILYWLFALIRGKRK